MKRLKETRRGVRITTHNGCQIIARRAVIGAGFESRELLKAEAGTLKSTYALISEPLSEIPGWHQQCLIWESGIPYLYLRTTTEARIIIGGEDEDFVNGQATGEKCAFRRTNETLRDSFQQSSKAGSGISPRS